MTKENATSGKLVAGTGLSTNGNHAQSHSSTVFTVGSRAIWRNADHDQPVVLSALLGEQNGVRYWGVEGSSTGVPEHELSADHSDLLGELGALLADAKVEPADAMTAGKVQRSAELSEFLLSAGYSDEGNAQAVARLFDGRFLHSEALGWVYHTGSHWDTENAEAAIDRAIVATLIARIEEASRPENFETHDGLRKFCTPNKSRVMNAKGMLTSIVATTPAAFDAEPDMLNCRNGVLDLRSGALVAHDPSQRFMHCTSVDYRPNANQDVWQSWLKDAVGNDAADWLQLAVGYSITGHTSEEVLFYLYGAPRSGKGTFTETLLALLGSPLAKEITFATFTAQRVGDTQNFDLAPLKPCRLVAASESNTYERFNEAKVKAITGGNQIYCAFKHKTHFGYRPQFKVWLSSNQPANADPDDDAVWGRLRMIEFPHSHLGAEDKRLKQRMRSRAVLEGVLAWAVAGAMRWYALGSAGLSEPASSVALKAQQRGDLDNVGAWLEECTTQGIHAPASRLYQSYEQWCKAIGTEPKRQKAFGVSLIRKGFKPDRAMVEMTIADGTVRKQVRVFTGLKLIE